MIFCFFEKATIICYYLEDSILSLLIKRRKGGKSNEQYGEYAVTALGGERNAAAIGK